MDRLRTTEYRGKVRSPTTSSVPSTLTFAIETAATLKIIRMTLIAIRFRLDFDSPSSMIKDA